MKKGQRGESDSVACDHPANYRIVLLLRTRARDVPIEADMGLVVCEEHKAGIKFSDVVTPEGWDRIVAGFLMINRPPPVQENCNLEFRVIE